MRYTIIDRDGRTIASYIEGSRLETLALNAGIKTRQVIRAARYVGWAFALEHRIATGRASRFEAVFPKEKI